MNGTSLIGNGRYYITNSVCRVSIFDANSTRLAAMSSENEEVCTKMEFAVQMSCSSCEEAVKRALEGVRGITKVYANLSDEVVLIESSLPSSVVQRLLEDTGRLVVFRGFGGQDNAGASPNHHGAAVAALKSYGAGSGLGLARLVQATPTQCVVEATIDGLPEGHYTVKVHEYGDLSQGCDSCGSVYFGDGESAGSLGSLSVGTGGRATLHTVSQDLHVWDLIGRSIVVHSPQNRLLCGIIARSAGLFQNSKKFCSCDGVTIWEEAKQTKSTSDSIQSSL